MEFQEILDWAFQRHLNPLSWYIRPIFLLILCYFAYQRSWKGIIITFILMTSSMVWFPAPEEIDPQMQEVLAFENKALGSPGSAVLTLTIMFAFLFAVLYAFWKRSLLIALLILNISIVGKLVLSLLFTGASGWGTLPVTLFGLFIANSIAFMIYRYFYKNKPLKESIKK